MSFWKLGVASLAGAAVALALARRAEGKRRPGRRSGSYHAGIIKVKPEMLEQYMALHDNPWQEVMARMHASNMRDFTVWLHAETNKMFHQFVYVGDDFEADMAAVAQDPIVRFWWSYCEPCQEPMHWVGPPPSQGGTGDARYPGQWWAPLQQLNSCGAWSTAWSNVFPDPDFQPKHPAGATTTKDEPPTVHNRHGGAAGWTSYTQTPPELSS